MAMHQLEWHRCPDEHWNDPSKPEGYTYRAKIHGGWLVTVWAGDDKTQRWGGGLTFVPDPKHEWDANAAKDW